MRTLILAVLFGLFTSSVATAAPSNTCKFIAAKSGLAFSKACTATERRLLPHAVESIRTPYVLKADLKSAKGSAQDFYTRHCKKVVGRRKATSRNWAKCYKELPSSMLMQQMMIPSVSLKTYVWEVCGKIRNLDKLASCAAKAATNENGQINNTIFEAVEAYRTLKRQKATARKYIKAVTGGCKLSAFGKLQCASSAALVLAAILMFLLGRLRPQLRVAIGIIAMIVGAATCVSKANAECIELSSYEEAHKAGDMYARMRFQVQAATALPLLKILVDEDASQSIKKFAIKTLNEQVWCNVGSNTKEIISSVKATKDFLKTTCNLQGEKLVCAGFSPVSSLLFIITLLTARRSKREEWYDFEALGYLDARKMVWAMEDELWKARWVERLIEALITLSAFSFGGLVLGLASAFLAQKRYGWASIFALLISVLFWGSALEWVLFGIKAVMTFLANTDEGFGLLRSIAHWRWKRQISKLK